MKTLEKYAMSMVGLPYKWGGDDPIKGFDCSGLVIELLQSCGMLPRGYDTTASGLYHRFLKSGNQTVLGFGSLVFYGKGTHRITHVGFMIDEWRMIEAGGGNSRTVNRDVAASQNAFIRIRPIDFRKDLVAVVKPKYNF